MKLCQNCVLYVTILCLALSSWGFGIGISGPELDVDNALDCDAILNGMDAGPAADYERCFATPENTTEVCESAIAGFEAVLKCSDAHSIGTSLVKVRTLDDFRLNLVSVAHFRLSRLFFEYADNLDKGFHHSQIASVMDTERETRNMTRVADSQIATMLKEMSTVLLMRSTQAHDMAEETELFVDANAVRWQDFRGLYWISLLFGVIPMMLIAYVISYFTDSFGHFAAAFKDKELEKEFWEQEDRNSLQRATFFISLALPIIVPQMLIFGGLLAYFTVAEFSIILLYTTSNPQANVWKWVSRLESVALLTLAPLVIWHRSNSGWVDLPGRVLIVPILRMFWSCLVTVSITELAIQSTISCIAALVLNITAQTLSSQMQRGIMVINLTFMVFCWCNMLYYERRRNFLVLVDVLNKNTVLQYLENNGNVVSFTVEVKNDGATEIVGVSKSCQRLYGYYPTEVVGRPDESFISAGHAERVKAYNRRAVEALTRVGEDASPADQDRKVKRRLRYFRVLANSQVVWVYAVGFYCRKGERIMLYYQEHAIQDERDENDRRLNDVAGEYEDALDDLNVHVENAIARQYTINPGIAHIIAS